MPSQLLQLAPGLLRWTGAGGPFDYEVSPRVFVPTLTSEAIVEALGQVTDLGVVLDIGCGAGFLAIVAARLGARRVYATDVSRDAVRLARTNADRAGVGDCVRVVCSDGLEAFPAHTVNADVVINDISGVPDILASRLGWYPEGAVGGGDGITLPLRVIDGLPQVLRPDTGVLVQPLGSVQFTPAIKRRLDALFKTRTVAAYRQFFLPKQAMCGDLSEINSLRQQGRMRLWEARGLTWWEAEVHVCEGLRERYRGAAAQPAISTNEGSL
ncbi:MAG TPA: class I SAM-dependent methyltransferase [Candidatus Dormibacteraeota bacterium]